MSKKEENIENLSESKQRKLERAKKRADEKKARFIWKIVGIVILVLIVGGIAFSIGRSIYKSVNTVEASNDFSAELTDNGFIKGVTAKDDVVLADYKNIVVPSSEIEYSEEALDSEIQTILESYKVVNSETEEPVKDGDTVSINYLGTIDGVAFDGGSTDGTPTDLTIGSGSYIDNFEEQLIGLKVGDQKDVEVTFPDDYGNTELAGKAAIFDVTVEGIYDIPEFTDEFVESNFADFAKTTDEYRNYLKNKHEDENLEAYVENFLAENSTVNSYPKAYLKNQKSVKKYNDQQSYEYMNQMSVSYNGSAMYETFYDYVGKSESEYDASLEESCKETVKDDMVYQAILESEGITLTEADYRAYLNDLSGTDNAFDTMTENRGIGDTMKGFVKIKALEIAKNNAKVQ